MTGSAWNRDGRFIRVDISIRERGAGERGLAVGPGRRVGGFLIHAFILALTWNFHVKLLTWN